MMFGALECIVIGAVVVGGLLIWNYVAVSRQEARERVTGIASKPPEIDWSAISDPEIQDFIARDQKINAIKRYRELTGVGLKEAKDAIEFAEVHPEAAVGKKKKAAYDAPDAGIRDLVKEGEIERAVEVYRVFAGVDEYTARDAIREIEREIRLEDDDGSAQDTRLDNARIQELLRQGNKIEAIKVYREMTGLGLKEAKDAVDAIERGQMF